MDYIQMLCRQKYYEGIAFWGIIAILISVFVFRLILQIYKNFCKKGD